MNSCYVGTEVPSSAFLWFDYDVDGKTETTRFWLENITQGNYDNEWFYSGTAENFSSKYKYQFTKVSLNSKNIIDDEATGAGSYYLETPNKPAYSEETVGLVETPPDGYEPLVIDEYDTNTLHSVDNYIREGTSPTINTINYEGIGIDKLNLNTLELFFTYKEATETSYNNEWLEATIMPYGGDYGRDLNVEMYSPDFKPGTEYNLILSTEPIDDLSHSPVPYYTITDTTLNEGVTFKDATGRTDGIYSDTGSYKMTDDGAEKYDEANPDDIFGMTIFLDIPNDYSWSAYQYNSTYYPHLSFEGPNTDNWIKADPPQEGAPLYGYAWTEIDLNKTVEDTIIFDDMYVKVGDYMLPVDSFYTTQYFPKLKVIETTSTTATISMVPNDQLTLGMPIEMKFVYTGVSPAKSSFDSELNAWTFEIENLKPNTTYTDQKVYWSVSGTPGYSGNIDYSEPYIRLYIEDFTTKPSNWSSTASLNTGAIVGISIGSLAGVGLIGSSIYFYKKRSKIIKKNNKEK